MLEANIADASKLGANDALTWEEIVKIAKLTKEEVDGYDTATKDFIEAVKDFHEYVNGFLTDKDSLSEYYISADTVIVEGEKGDGGCDHVFEQGFCKKCGIPDPNYTPPKTIEYSFPDLNITRCCGTENYDDFRDNLRNGTIDSDD
jgi:hypothetical protein